MMRCVERAASIWLLWLGHRILDEGSLNRTDAPPSHQREPDGRVAVYAAMSTPDFWPEPIRRAMYHMKPTSSRATAVIATCDFLPRPRSCR